MAGASSYFVEWDTVSSFNSAALRSATSAASQATVGPLSDGTWYWRVTARDEVGNVSLPSTADSFLVDTVSPAAPGVLLALGDTHVQSGVGVRVDISAPGSAQMQVAMDGVIDAEPWETLQSPVFRSLAPAGDGSRTVLVRVRDLAGNESLVTGATVKVDSSAPMVGSVLVGDGSGYVTSGDG